MHPLSFVGISTLAVALTLYYAWSICDHEYYSTVIFLSANKFAKLILSGFAISIVALIGYVIRALFLGPLRPIEVEVLYENSRYAVVETCLALTIFREDVSPRVVGFFTLLLFFKSFHWLLRLRVEHVEQIGILSRLTHTRLVGLHIFLLLIDLGLVNVCFSLVINQNMDVLYSQKPSMLILFAFEFAILALQACSTFSRYLLHLVDAQINGGWHAKHTIMFFIEFITDIMRFFFYFVFFSIVFLYYGIPIYFMRDLWVSYTNIRKRIQMYIRYRKLTSNMDEKFPNATEEELEGCEHTCIICRDIMSIGKLLPCGHIYHVFCLQMWLLQQQTCPTCRVDISDSFPVQRNIQGSPRPGVEVNVTPTSHPSNAGLNGSKSSQAGDTDSVSCTPNQAQTKALRVVAAEARIYNSPSCAEGTLIVRRIQKGTFLVILGQTRTRSGEHFFRVMDGWIPEIELGLTIVERLSYPDRMRSSPPYYTQHPSLSPCLPVRQTSPTSAVIQTGSEHKQRERSSPSTPSDSSRHNQQLTVERQIADLKVQLDELKKLQEDTSELLASDITFNEGGSGTSFKNSEETKLTGELLCEPLEEQSDENADVRKNCITTPIADT